VTPSNPHMKTAISRAVKLATYSHFLRGIWFIFLLLKTVVK